MATIPLANLSDVGIVASGATATGTTYAALAPGTYFIDPSGAFTFSLPLPSQISFGQLLMVKDTSGAAATNPINLVGTGGALIDGSAQYTIEVDYGAAILSWNGTDRV